MTAEPLEGLAGARFCGAPACPACWRRPEGVECVGYPACVGVPSDRSEAHWSAFVAWRETAPYRRAAAWALYEPETDGALEDAFAAGFAAATAVAPGPPLVSPLALGVFGALDRVATGALSVRQMLGSMTAPADYAEYRPAALGMGPTAGRSLIW